MDDYERVLLVKPDVHVYKIPPRVTNRAYRASDWNLDTPDWNCRLRLISKGDECYIKLDEKSTGQFFGKCPIDKYPGMAIEPVSDSSRYFVLRLMNEQNGRTAFVGIGFVDRSDSFDLNVALQDHFKIIELENKGDTDDNIPKLDLKFKEGETIKVNLNIGTKSNVKCRPKPSTNNKGMGILLPPPPSNLKSSSNNVLSNRINVSDHSKSDLTDDLKSLHISKNSLLKLDNNHDEDNNIESNKNETKLPKNNEIDWINFSDSKSTMTTNNNSLYNKEISNTSKNQNFEADTVLWSDFTSCNIRNNSSSSQSSNQLDDWAKF